MSVPDNGDVGINNLLRILEVGTTEELKEFFLGWLLPLTVSDGG